MDDKATSEDACVARVGRIVWASSAIDPGASAAPRRPNYWRTYLWIRTVAHFTVLFIIVLLDVRPCSEVLVSVPRLSHWAREKCSTCSRFGVLAFIFTLFVPKGHGLPNTLSSFVCILAQLTEHFLFM